MSEEILKLKKEIERLKKSVKKQRYGLVWMDVPEAFDNDVENKLPILKEVPELAIKNNDGKPTHILIEGDNYHALTCLNYTNKGKIDFIYIDPPYNTGSDGFRYKDKRILDKYPDGTEVPKDHPFRHSYWLSFISKRLELAKDILKESGVIFISIDDNESAQLKLLCDEIFGERNFISQLTIETGEVFGTKASHIDKTFVKVKDYVLVYVKNSQIDFKKNPLYDSMNELYDTHFNTVITKKLDRIPICNFLKKEGWVSDLFRKFSLELKIDNINKMMALDEKFKEYINKDLGKILFTNQPYTSKIPESVENHLKKDGIAKHGNIVLYKTKTGSIRYYQSFSDGVHQTDDYISRFNRASIRGDLWKSFHYDMRNIDDEGGVLFKNGKKPTRLIKQLLKWTNCDKNSIILDFFAGSGTTGEAVINLNKDDDGLRQFILVTNNDEVINGTKHKIMSDICYPRIEKISKISGNGVKFYKTAFIGKNNILNATDQDKIELAHNAGELLAIAENTLELTKQNKFYQLFEDGNKEKYTAVYFREELDKFDEFTEIVKKLKKQTAVYVFSWGNDEEVEEFDDTDQIKIKTIPLPILEIYKQIYNLSTE